MEALMTQTPRLLAGIFRRPRLDLLALMCDLTVPPLSLLTLLWTLLFGASLVTGAWLEVWLPAGLLLLAGVLLAGSIGMAWLRFGRHALPATALLTVPAYMASKLPLYLSFLFNRQRAWVRTDRGSR